LRVALAAFCTIAALAGSGLVIPAAAEPIYSGSADVRNDDVWADRCLAAGREFITIEDGYGNAVESSCSFGGGVETCNYISGQCWVDRVQPTTNPLQDTRPGGTGGVFVDETITPVIEGDTGTAGDQQVMFAADAATDQAGACEGAGGTATTIDNGTRGTATVDVRCKGGVLDGMVCRNGHYQSVCDFYRGETGPDEDPNVTPTGGIMFVQLEPLADGEDTTDIRVMPGLAEDPTGTDTVVIANQSGSTVTDNATGQVGLCRLAGGKESVNVKRTASGGLIWVDVGCTGGLLDGMACLNGNGYTICALRGELPEGPRVTPAAGIEDPAGDVPNDMDAGTDEQLTPTAVPTETTPEPTAAPTEPTVTPTETPAEPTVAPTTAPQPPKNDNAVPPGETGDPTEGEPTPTVHVIL
jgi:hypothetical protein